MSRFRSIAERGEATDLDRPSLEAVLEHYHVRFHPGRQSQMVSCPLHEDRTPSMSVNLVKELFRCHSCGEGGDVYALIMLKEETDFAGAVEFGATFSGPAGRAGGGGDSLPEGRISRRGAVSARKRSRQGGRAWRPTWTSG